MIHKRVIISLCVSLVLKLYFQVYFIVTLYTARMNVLVLTLKYTILCLIIIQFKLIFILYNIFYFTMLLVDT